MKREIKILIILIFVSTTLLTSWNVSVSQQWMGKSGYYMDPINYAWHVQKNNSFTANVKQTKNLAINFYLNPKLVDRGYVLNNNDIVCVGDTIEIDSVTVSGEWFGKGGPEDTPPITWVSSNQMSDIINNVKKYQSHTTGEIPVTIPIARYIMGSFPIYALPATTVSNKEALGMKITLYKTPLFYAGRFYPWVYGTLICTSNQITFKGRPIENGITVSYEGQLKFDATAKPKCYFYLEKTITVCEWGYLEDCSSKQPTEKYYYLLSNPIEGPTMLSIINLFAAKASNGAKLEIIDKSSTSNGQTTIILTLKNSGDTGAILDDVTSSVPLTITHKPPIIKSGETDVVYLQTPQAVDTDSLQFVLSYRSETLGCQKTKSVTTAQVSCTSSSQCSTNLCCAGECRDATKGSCVDIDGDGILDWVPY